MNTDANRDKLITDVKTLMADADDIVKAMASATGEKATELGEKLRIKLRSAKEKMGAVQEGILRRSFLRGGQYLDQVYAAARAGAVHLDGQNIFIYRAATASLLTVDFCVGVTAPFAAVGAVVPLETPHGVAAMTTHSGDYGRLGNANAAIVAWCRANDRPCAGPSWEVYGHWHADPARLRTDIYYLLQAVTS